MKNLTARETCQLLDVLVTNLNEAKRTEELDSWNLYDKLQQKMTDVNKVQTLGSWVRMRQKCRSNPSIFYWRIRISYGISRDNPWFPKSQYLSEQCWQLFVVWTRWKLQEGQEKQKMWILSVWSQIWLSNTFKEENVNRIWEFLKKLKLCFWCLGSNHLSKSRRNSRICLIDRCTNTCNCLLHKKKPENIEEQNLQQSHKKHERESLENSHTSAVLKESWPNNKIYRLFLLS